jgi:hypothetical protein
MTVRVAVAMAIVLCTAGCAPWATHPPIQGAAQIGQPHHEPIPSIMAEAIRDTYERRIRPARPPAPDTADAADTEAPPEIVFNLPPHTHRRAWEQVAAKLGPNARPMTSPDEPAVHIATVRVRTTQAEVDVIYPRPDGHYQLATLTMRQKAIGRHAVTATRLWRIRAEPPPMNHPE